MSIEKLLKPRYLVIADYPRSELEVGKIITMLQDRSGEWYSPFAIEFESYPHLFKKLEWYAERKESEMPEYVRCIETPDQVHFPNCVYKVKWELLWGRDESNVPIILSTNCYLPATEEEFQYQQNKKCMIENEKILVAQYNHFSHATDICDYINRHKIEPQHIISVNNDERGNWWLFYFWLREKNSKTSECQK